LERTALIDAATFASQYSAFWRTVAPTSELLVRRINLGLKDRFAPPLQGAVSSTAAALVAETGFSAFELTTEDSSLRANPGDLIALALGDAMSRFRGLPSSRPEPALSLTAEEMNYALSLCDRLRAFFSMQAGPLTIRPRFRGCGFVDTSEGDVFVGETLFEVKSVERGFRSADLFQLLTYYALSKSTESTPIVRLGVVNPKRGLSFDMDIDDLCRSVSGVGAVEMVGEIIDAISSGGISR